MSWLGNLNVIWGTVLFAFLHELATAGPLDIWVQRSPIPTADRLRFVLFANGQYLASGGIRTILRSKDAMNWTIHKLPADTMPYVGISGIAYGAGQFVATGGQGVILTSTDAVHWIPQWSGVDLPLHSVTFGNGQFVAVGGFERSNNRAILTSGDTIRWKVIRVSDETTLKQVVFGGNTFVAVGSQGTILTSVDGNRWLSYFTPSSRTLTGVAFGNGRFVVVGGYGQLLTSTNGVQWTHNVLPLRSSSAVVAFDGSRFLVAGDNDKVWISDDGMAWTSHATSLLDGPLAITHGGGKFVAVGDHGFVATSSNGLDWQSPSYGLNKSFDEVEVGNGQILVNASGELIGTADGIRWTPRGPDYFYTVALGYGSGMFVAFGRDNRNPVPALVMSSANGVDWVTHRVTSTIAAQRIIHADGQFVAVGATVFTSKDAVRWTVQTPFSTAELTDVAYGNGRFVAVGESGSVFSSVNATDWRRHTTGTNWLQRVTFGNGRFVGIGVTFWTAGNALGVERWDVILTSLDGEHWTSQTLPRSPGGDIVWHSSIEYGGGWFVVVGVGSEILISEDGRDWQFRDTGTAGGFSSVRYANGQFAVVGASGTLLTSDNVLLSPLTDPVATPTGLQFTVHGDVGETFRIEATSDLASPKWIGIGDITKTAPAAIFLDPIPKTSPARYYRAVRTGRF